MSDIRKVNDTSFDVTCNVSCIVGCGESTLADGGEIIIRLSYSVHQASPWLSFAFRSFSPFHAPGLCHFWWESFPSRLEIFPFLLPISGPRDKTSGFPAKSPKSICTIKSLVVLVMSPIQTTCDLKTSKTLFLSYGVASVGVVLFQISNAGRESQMKPPIALLSKNALS